MDTVNYLQPSQAANVRNAVHENTTLAQTMICSVVCGYTKGSVLIIFQR